MKKNKICFFVLLLATLSSCSGSGDCVKRETKDSGRPDYISMFESKVTLSRCSRYRINSFEPKYDSILHEGNIAYYGLIAQAFKNYELAEKVADVSTDSCLWEYGYGYGATSADSAIVLEALIELGVRKEKTEKSIENLISKYYNEAEGCFNTVKGSGRARYWKGCSAEVTAHIAYLIHRFDDDKYRDVVEKSAIYVAKNTNMENLWSSRWFPSFTIPTYYGIRLLTIFEGKYNEIIKKAAEAVVSRIREDGSWDGSVIETSAATLALKNVKGYEKQTAPAREWLRNHVGTEPEPVLFYWFEEGRNRLFFSCYDNGHISEAWKKLALEK